MRAMSPEQHQQCRRFLAELRRTGNVQLSAERVGLSKQTLQTRRRANPAFATEWAAALAFARAALAKAGSGPDRSTSAKTLGGEYEVRKGRGGEFQVKRAHAGRLTEAGETLFLQTLAATCNISLSCHAAGMAKSNIYARRRCSPHFADRMDAALAQGHERLEFAVMEAALCSLGPDEMAAHWVDLGVEPPSPLAVMTFDQVIQAMGMHMKRVVLGEKRRGRNEHVTTAEETDAAITKLLGNLNKRERALEKIDWETGEARVIEAGSVAAIGQGGGALRIAEAEAVPQPALPARIRFLS